MRILEYGKYWAAALLIAGSFASCSKQDDTYKQFLEDGEIVYVGKADSLIALPGKNRVELSWLLIADPNVSKAKVFWNNGADSLEFPVIKTEETDTVTVVIPGLEEGSYVFEVYTYDPEGNSSVKSEATVEVYGDNYQTSLLNRPLNNILYGNNELVLSWASPGEGALGSQLTYSGRSGETHTLWVGPETAETLLVDYQPNSAFQYSTFYLPDTLSIDTFRTPVSPIEVSMQFQENVALDKSLFTALPLPGDPTPWNMEGNELSNLWSGVLAGNQADKAFYRTANGTGMPQHFQLDLGVSVKLSHFRMWQRGTVTEHNLLFANANLKRWEIWGSQDPAENGSYDGWVKLMDCEAFKPSGLPVGKRSDEDIAYAQAGEEFVFPEDVPEVRYVRINVLETWGGNQNIFTSEIAFRGSYWMID